MERIIKLRFLLTACSIAADGLEGRDREVLDHVRQELDRVLAEVDPAQGSATGVQIEDDAVLSWKNVTFSTVTQAEQFVHLVQARIVALFTTAYEALGISTNLSVSIDHHEGVTA